VIEDRDQDRRGVSGEVAPDLGYHCFPSIVFWCVVVQVGPDDAKDGDGRGAERDGASREIRSRLIMRSITESHSASPPRRVYLRARGLYFFLQGTSIGLHRKAWLSLGSRLS